MTLIEPSLSVQNETDTESICRCPLAVATFCSPPPPCRTVYFLSVCAVLSLSVRPPWGQVGRGGGMAHTCELAEPSTAGAHRVARGERTTEPFVWRAWRGVEEGSLAAPHLRPVNRQTMWHLQTHHTTLWLCPLVCACSEISPPPMSVGTWQLV